MTKTAIATSNYVPTGLAWSQYAQDLIIPHCAAENCGFKCCLFTDNYILLYPYEWEQAEQSGFYLGHYDVLEVDEFNGRRVRPTSKKCCSMHTPEMDKTLKLYKPLDCASYPYFPVVNKDGSIRMIAGSKCPLIGNKEGKYLWALDRQRATVVAAWNAVVLDNPDVREWLKKKVQMVGYEEVG